MNRQESNLLKAAYRGEKLSRSEKEDLSKIYRGLEEFTAYGLRTLEGSLAGFGMTTMALYSPPLILAGALGSFSGLALGAVCEIMDGFAMGGGKSDKDKTRDMTIGIVIGTPLGGAFFGGGAYFSSHPRISESDALVYGSLMGAAFSVALTGSLARCIYQCTPASRCKLRGFGLPRVDIRSTRIAKRSLIAFLASAAISSSISLGIAGYNEQKDSNYLSNGFENLPIWRQIGDSSPLK